MASQRESCFLLMSTLLTVCMGQYYRPSTSMCETAGYRELPVEVQNEHQCLVLEQIHSSVRNGAARRDNLLNQIITRINKLEDKMGKELSKVNNKVNKDSHGFPALKDIPVSRDCNELRMAGVKVSGVYPIQLPNGLAVNVQCDMDTDGGGWTVVQQRRDGTTNFTRKWNDYAFGFGNVNTEYWLGNENLHSLTSAIRYSLRVDIWDWKDNQAHALYEYFHVDSEKMGYRLAVEGYANSSTAGDSLAHHNGMSFTTIDRDNDRWWANCAMKDRSGWWFNKCSYCSLNGLYRKSQEEVSPDGTSTGITWFHWKRIPGYSLKRVEMKVKPIAAVLTQDQENAQADVVFN